MAGYTKILAVTAMEGPMEDLFMFAFVVKIHPKQPIMSAFSGMNAHNDYNG